MSMNVGLCGNMVHLGKKLSKQKSDKVQKAPEQMGTSASSYVGKAKPKVDFSKFDFSAFTHHKSDPQASAPLTDQQKKIAQAVANLDFVHIRKH